MARPLRIEFPGAISHVTSRGNAQAAIFLDDIDRKSCLSVLGLAYILKLAFAYDEILTEAACFHL